MLPVESGLFFASLLSGTCPNFPCRRGCIYLFHEAAVNSYFQILFIDGFLGGLMDLGSDGVLLGFFIQVRIISSILDFISWL